MSLILITPPAAHPVTLEEAKAHVRVEFDDEDAMIAAYIEAATAHLDGRDGALGRCLMAQTWALRLEAFPSQILLPLPPCRSVTSVAYIDPAGATRTLSSDHYDVTGLGAADGATIRPARDRVWPQTAESPEAVTITFEAGHATAAEVPAPIRLAILDHVARLFDARGSKGDVAQFAGDGLASFKTWAF